MKKWAFVSDFDGTISKKDFYWIVIEKYFPEGSDMVKQWKEGEIKDIDFLSTVFSSIHQNEAQIIEDVLEIPIDEHVPEFIKKVQEHGGDFYILSAGTDYYINYILDHYNIKNVTVLSNKGYYEDQNIHLHIDPEHRYHSDRYGIDKATVLEELKQQYETIHFAGDSEPDSHPAVHADVTFAKAALPGILSSKGVPHITVDNFKDIEAELIRTGFLTND